MILQAQKQVLIYNKFTLAEELDACKWTEACITKRLPREQVTNLEDNKLA
jgi:hypothetical protein